MEVVLTSLMMGAFHAYVMSSMIAMGGRDRTDLPMGADDWICPSRTSGEKEGLQLLKIEQGPGNRLHHPRSNRGGGGGAESFSTMPPRVSAMAAPHDTYIYQWS